MAINVVFVDHADQAQPTQRFPQSRVNSEPFKWHRFAKPGPVYALCLVKILDVHSPTQIRVQCFKPDGQLAAPQVDVNLADWNHAWPTSPSTIGPLPATTAGLGSDSCAILCLSRALLGKAGVPPEVEFAKYPYVEAEAEARLKNLEAALRALRATMAHDIFDAVLREHQIDLR